MADAPALEALDVCKKYEGAEQNALQDVSLKVKAGEFYSFLGPSGCGKTTMLRIFAGFESATRGQVFVAGALMNEVPPNKRPVNMVFQSYALFPHLSVLENVAFGLRAKGGINKNDIFTQSKEALAIVRLSSFGDRKPAQLSGGQQQRVALARALVMRPVVLLLDEPLSALDIQIREEMQEELSRLQRQLNITFVMVTHDQSEALALSTSVAVFNQGRIEQIGDPRTIYDVPDTAFVAKFIGRSNVLSAKVLEIDKDELLVGLFDGCQLYCSMAGAGKGKAPPNIGEFVDLCIKPEAILPDFVGGASDAALRDPFDSGSELSSSGRTNRLRCRLESSSYQGSMADLRLSILGAPQAMMLRASLPASLLAGASCQSDLTFSLAPGALRLLPGLAARDTQGSLKDSHAAIL